MCLDVDGDDEMKFEVASTPKARKAHKCQECSRTITPGETYHQWKGLADDWFTHRMCAHCWATIEMGAAITGCPKMWYFELIHGLDPDDGAFVGDILANHDLSFGDEFRMLRRVVEQKRLWRRPNGALYPLPLIPVVA